MIHPCTAFPHTESKRGWIIDVSWTLDPPSPGSWRFPECDPIDGSIAECTYDCGKKQQGDSSLLSLRCRSHDSLHVSWRLHAWKPLIAWWWFVLSWKLLAEEYDTGRNGPTATAVLSPLPWCQTPGFGVWKAGGFMNTRSPNLPRRIGNTGEKTICAKQRSSQPVNTIVGG